MKPDAFAAIMATGIVSIAAANHGYHVVSNVLAGLAAVGLPVLMVIAAVTWRRTPPDPVDPDVAVKLFTFVAACAVLDARLVEIPGALWTLAVLAAVTWLVLTVLTARTIAAHRWSDLQARARGAWELPSVGTSGLAIVIVALAQFTDRPVLLWGAAGMWILALVIYALMTALILGRAFAARLDPYGFEPDAWILMGGLAIAALAGDYLHRELGGWPSDVVRGGAELAWVVATMWILPLTYFAVRHLRRPGARRFAGAWWSMVFPLGMYSAATHAFVVETPSSVLSAVSRAFSWIALGAWVIVSTAALRSLTGRRTA